MSLTMGFSSKTDVNRHNTAYQVLYSHLFQLGSKQASRASIVKLRRLNYGHHPMPTLPVR